MSCRPLSYVIIVGAKQILSSQAVQRSPWSQVCFVYVSLGTGAMDAQYPHPVLPAARCAHAQQALHWLTKLSYKQVVGIIDVELNNKISTWITSAKSVSDESRVAIHLMVAYANRLGVPLVVRPTGMKFHSPACDTLNTNRCDQVLCQTRSCRSS